MDMENVTLRELAKLHRESEEWERLEPLRAYSDALAFLRPFRSSKP
jgi:hypothetical protein